jgi:hypothetical protein
VARYLIPYARRIADAPLDVVPQISWGNSVLASAYRRLPIARSDQWGTTWSLTAARRKRWGTAWSLATTRRERWAPVVSRRLTASRRERWGTTVSRRLTGVGR